MPCHHSGPNMARKTHGRAVPARWHARPARDVPPRSSPALAHHCRSPPVPAHRRSRPPANSMCIVRCSPVVPNPWSRARRLSPTRGPTCAESCSSVVSSPWLRAHRLLLLGRRESEEAGNRRHTRERSVVRWSGWREREMGIRDLELGGGSMVH